MIPALHERYARVDHAWLMSHCFLCERELPIDSDGMIIGDDEEVGEFWADAFEDSVLIHPDCLPQGIDAVFEGTDPDWKLA